MFDMPFANDDESPAAMADRARRADEAREADRKAAPLLAKRRAQRAARESAAIERAIAIAVSRPSPVRRSVPRPRLVVSNARPRAHRVQRCAAHLTAVASAGAAPPSSDPDPDPEPSAGGAA